MSWQVARFAGPTKFESSCILLLLCAFELTNNLIGAFMDLPTIRLLPMTPEQLSTFLEEDIPRYAADNMQAGFLPESDALQRAQESFDRFLPKGVETPGQYLFLIHDTEASLNVGMVWVGAQPDGAEHLGFIYNLYIAERYRRRGFARQAVLHVEQHARQLGWTSLGLHVFGDNAPARKPYASPGYEVLSMNIFKAIESTE